MWGRSTDAKKMNPALNSCCRLITGCLRATPSESLYSLAAITPSDVRRQLSSMQERERQTTDDRHPMFNQSAAPKILRSRGSFLLKKSPPSWNSLQRSRKTRPVEREIPQITSYGSSTQWAAIIWSWFHNMAWVAVSQQTDIRSWKVQGRSGATFQKDRTLPVSVELLHGLWSTC